MNYKLTVVLVLSLLAVGGLISACGSSSPATQDTVDRDSDGATLQPPQQVAGEIVSGELGMALDEFITRDRPLFSGSILVARDGEILLSKGYNYANWELKAPNSSRTKYRISSITKPFTATMIMMLAQNGLLELDDPICDHLSNCPDSWGEITIHDLLSHTSGVPDYTRLEGASNDSRLPHSVAELVEIFRDEQLEFSPGANYQYSNSNYILLGALIEGVSGVSYDQFLQNAILNPLGLEDTGMDYTDQVLSDRASGYSIQGRTLVNAPYLNMSNAYATAGMYSTVGDLYTFDQALQDGQLLSLDDQALMYAPIQAGDNGGGEYGLGWQVSESDNHRRVGHSGGINGFRVFFGRYLDDGTTIILLSNIETEELDPIIAGLEQIVFDGG